MPLLPHMSACGVISITYMYTTVYICLQLMTLPCRITTTQSSQFTLWFVPGVVHSADLDNCVAAWVHHGGVIQSSFAALKILRVPLFRPFLGQSLQFCFCQEVHRWKIQDVVFSERLLSLSVMHLSSSMSFGDFIPRLIFNTGDIPLSGSAIAALSIHLLKDIWVASKFWHLRRRLCKLPCAGICADVSFHLLWVNIKKHDCWMA